MAYQPHTDADVQRMLERLGLGDVDELFAPIPAELRAPDGLDLPEPHAEQEIAAEMGRLAGRNRHLDELTCFLGAGVYDHYVPAVVWYLAGRGEFATAYTPYQPEMSQGVLQALFEYQTLISELTGCAISNASLYDGASSVAEAATMAVAATGRSELLVSASLAPRVRALLATYAAGLGVELIEVATVDGHTDLDDARRKAGPGTAALLLAQPSFLGVLEDVPAAAEIAHAAGARLITMFDPIAAGLLEPPGRLGADIVVGEGQALGNHPNFGGPAFGFLACGVGDVRRLPGRLVGETVDAVGTRGYVLTLQAREQHIRREKATSNICTNQTLNALAAAIYLAWLGPAGLAELAGTCHRAARYAAERLTAIPGVDLAFGDQPFFKEFAVTLPADPEEVCRRLADRGHLAGLPLTAEALGALGTGPGMGRPGLLVAVTERRTRAEIDALATDLAAVVAELAPEAAATATRPAPTAARDTATAASSLGGAEAVAVTGAPTGAPAAVPGHGDGQALVAEPAPWAAGGRAEGAAEPLIFERSAPGRRASTLPDPAGFPEATGPAVVPDAARRRTPLLLPEVSERDLVRHYTRLAHRNYAIDLGFYPLGSCTMKYNPKIAETVAAMPGFARLHPAQPAEQVQGALELLWRLEHALKELTGMAAVTFQPAAGAHGELTGLLLIRALHEANGEPRRRVVIPDAAHGTNPASVRLAGFEVTTVKSSQDGLIDLGALEAALGPDVAAFMITNPNTLGLFERNIHRVAELVHGVGGQLYYDGANFNAILGKVRPGDMGFDVVHMNLHKTFATPHGGGGPGAGPVGVAAHLVDFLPGPVVARSGDVYGWDTDRPRSIGRVHGWHGNFGIIVRAYAYLLANGGDGLRQVAERAVLNANYLLDRLLDGYELGYPTRPVMHEFVLSARKQKAHGARALDLAKALIDAGYHPPTVYFPLIVDEAMMVEPTETESVETLDAFAETLLALARQAEQDPTPLREAPTTAPSRRLDEARAARHLTTRWIPGTSG